MDPLQFSLFFTALLVGYILVHLRLVRFEKYLQEISVLRLLNERLQSVSDVLKGVSVEGVEERIDMLQSELRSLSALAARIEKNLAQHQVAEAAPASGEATPAERIRSLVETRLLSLGYSDLNILTDLSGTSMDEEVEVVLECHKNQMAYKGKVTACNGGIRDVDLQSVARAFP